MGGGERQEHAQRRPVGCAEAQARDDRSEDHAHRRTGCNGEHGEDDAGGEQRRRGAHRLARVEGARRQRRKAAGDHQRRDDGGADKRRADSGRLDHERGHQREVESAERPGGEGQREKARHRGSRGFRHGQFGPDSAPGAGLSRRRFGDPGEDNHLSQRHDEQHGIDQMGWPGRKGDEHARNERAERETHERRHAVERGGPPWRRIDNERAKRRQRDARRNPLHGPRNDERRGGPSDEEQEKRGRVEPKRQQNHRLAADIVRKPRDRQKSGDHREGIDCEDERDRERGQAQRLTIESVDRRRRG